MIADSASVLFFLSLCVLLGALNRAERVLRRRVNGIHLKRRVPDIDQIVPCSRRNDESTFTVHLAAAIHFVFARTGNGERRSALDAQELVGMAVNLGSDVSAHGNAHERYLQMFSRPQRGSVIVVAFCGAFHVNRERFAAEIAYSVGTAASVVIHIHYLLRNALIIII